MKTRRTHTGLKQKVRHFLVENDLFESTIVHSSLFGGFATFVLLPIISSVYLSVMYKQLFVDVFDYSNTAPSKNCTRFQFVCTSPYGCELGPAGPRSKTLFSRQGDYVMMEQGEEVETPLCPGIDEGLDIARRSSVRLDDEFTFASKVGFASGGYGYFGSKSGWVYKVDLKSMKLVQKALLTDIWLNFGFTWDGYGFFMSYHKQENKATIFKIDLPSLSLVKTHTFNGYRFWCGCVYNDFAFLGTMGSGYILKINLDDFTVVRSQNRIAGDNGNMNKLFACNVGDNGVGYFGGESKKIMAINLTSTKPELLQRTKGTISTSVLTSISRSGYHVGDNKGATMYNRRGENKDQYGKSYYDQGFSFGSRIVFVEEIPDPGQTGNLQRLYWKNATLLIVATEIDGVKLRSFSQNSEHGNLPFSADVSKIATAFIYGGFLYTVAVNGFVMKVDLRTFDFADASVPIGIIKDHHNEPLDFPMPKDHQSYYTLYKTIKVEKHHFGPNIPNQTFLQYWSRNVLDFDTNKCNTGQPNCLCRRVNLANIHAVDTKEPTYEFTVATNILFAGLSAIYVGLQIAVKVAQKYQKSERCCGCWHAMLRRCHAFWHDDDEDNEAWLMGTEEDTEPNDGDHYYEIPNKT